MVFSRFVHGKNRVFHRRIFVGDDDGVGNILPAGNPRQSVGKLFCGNAFGIYEKISVFVDGDNEARCLPVRFRGGIRMRRRDSELAQIVKFHAHQKKENEHRHHVDERHDINSRNALSASRKQRIHTRKRSTQTRERSTEAKKRARIFAEKIFSA